MKTKLAIIGCAGIPARYGGFETFAENISGMLKNSMEITVFCDKSFYNKNERTRKWKGINRKFLPLRANGPFSVFYDLISILISLGKSDVILILGAGSGIFIPFFSRIKKVKFITHLDGMEWIRPKWNFLVKKYLYYSFKQSIKNSDCLILDNSALKDYIPEKYHNKLIDVKYGGDHMPEIKNNEVLHTKPFALMICRAEPENNLQLIIKAFENISHLDLIIISNSSKTRLGRNLAKTYHHSRHIIFKALFTASLNCYRNTESNVKYTFMVIVREEPIRRLLRQCMQAVLFLPLTLYPIEIPHEILLFIFKMPLNLLIRSICSHQANC